MESLINRTRWHKLALKETKLIKDLFFPFYFLIFLQQPFKFGIVLKTLLKPSHKLTNVAGSSEYYLGGVVAYSNRLKESLLGVTHQTLNTFGAVSLETVREMTDGIRKITGSDLAVAISGIAGPSGGTEEKPVGTVCIGFSSKDVSEARTYRFFGSRIQVKQNSAAMALDWIRRYLCGYPFLPGI